ncbi:hypothetical protein ACGTN6_10705 [Halomonas sp. THAF12]|uniref:hypothetical protein n=1 Tax=Halomonas sp. B23F22_10 TaxID=3459515 RepID=UPI00373F4C1F
MLELPLIAQWCPLAAMPGAGERGFQAAMIEPVTEVQRQQGSLRARKAKLAQALMPPQPLGFLLVLAASPPHS